MKVVIVSAVADKIKTTLENISSGNKIIAYNTMEECYNVIMNSALRTDFFIIEDSAIKLENKIDSHFTQLSSILSHRFFRASMILFLNKSENVNFADRYEFLMEDFQNMKCNLVTQDTFRASDINKFLEIKPKEYKPVELDDVVICQKFRGKDLEPHSFVERDFSGSIKSSSFRPSKADQYKAPFQDNTMHLSLDSQRQTVEIDDFSTDFNIPYKGIKGATIAVTGLDNSGVSTTALVLANTSATMGYKTLLVDCDFINIGLSYLAEQLLKDKPLTNINLSDAFSKSLSYVKSRSYSDNFLHILTLNLSILKKAKNSLEMCILNILTQLKDSYQFIILDIPMRVIDSYTTLLNRSVDKIVMTSSPYLDKTISSLRVLSKSNIINTKAYYENNLCIAMLGLINRNLPIINRKMFNAYSNEFLGRELPCTKMFQLKNDLFISKSLFMGILSTNTNVNLRDINQLNDVNLSGMSQDTLEDKTQDITQNTTQNITIVSDNKSIQVIEGMHLTDIENDLNNLEPIIEPIESAANNKNFNTINLGGDQE